MDTRAVGRTTKKCVRTIASPKGAQQWRRGMAGSMGVLDREATTDRTRTLHRMSRP